MAETRRWAFWSDWSDLTKWIMGIISSLLVATLIGLISVVYSVANRESKLEPFANATTELHQAIIESATVTAEDMVTFRQRVGMNGEASVTYVTYWRNRVKLMDVLLGYSDALAGVAVASAKAQQTTLTLGISIIRLALIVPNTGSVIEDGVPPYQVFFETGLQITDCQNLGQAVGVAHPALAEVAKYLEAALEDLKLSYKLVSQEKEVSLHEEYEKRKSQLHELMRKRDKLRETAIETSFPNNIVEEIKKIEELIAHMEPEHQEYEQQLLALRQKRVITSQMLNKAKLGVYEWVRAHEELKLVIEENLRPNVRLILSTTQEINDAVVRFRNQ